MIGKYCIVRTYSAGVHCGFFASRNGKEVVLNEARRIWRWEGAFTLSAIALNGLGRGSQLSVAVPEILLTEAIEIIPCSEKSEKQLQEIAAHEPK